MSTGKNVTNYYTDYGFRIQEIIGSWAMDVSLPQAVTTFLHFPVLSSFQIHKYQLLSHSDTTYLTHTSVNSEH